ncbi:hypothetical protein [Streptomyces chumphonensis]|uniref:hypothetical protein n=1 Tax=Streptomyces chumphonensis TaxID=1214925 RepID=UPI003D7156F5
MTRCSDCGRRLSAPSRDGLGPVCRAKRLSGDPLSGARGLRPVPGEGQTVLPLAVPLPRRPVWPRVWRGRRVTTIPALPTYL